MTIDNKIEILKYIETERDISRFNIRTLGKIENLSASKKRILDIEREFVSIPFETFEFQDVADVAAAISIYRTSRSLFYKTYNVNKPKVLSDSELEYIIKSKKSIIRNTANVFLKSKVEEINLVQNEEMFFALCNLLQARSAGRKTLQDVVSDLEELTLDELNRLEPIILSKDRARRQAIIYSIGLYLDQEFSRIDTERRDASIVDELDNIINGIDKNIFKNFNAALDVLADLFNEGMGKNYSFQKVHKLKNLLDFRDIDKDLNDLPRISADRILSLSTPMICNISSSSKKVIGSGFSSEKRVKSKIRPFGILLPIQRVGNEKLSIMHARICACACELTSIMDDSLSNVIVSYNEEPTYFKALMMRPLWSILDSPDLLKYKTVLSHLFNHDIEDVEAFDLPEVIDKVNNSLSYIHLDNNSVIYSPKTRSEEESFDKIKLWIFSIISEIKNEYYNCTTNDGV